METRVLVFASGCPISIVRLSVYRRLAQFPLMIFFLGFLCPGSFGTYHSGGVVVLYHSVLDCRSVVCEFDGLFVLVEFAFRGFVFRVTLIYAPNHNSVHDDFFVRFVDYIDPAIPTLLHGDFNMLRWHVGLPQFLSF